MMNARFAESRDCYAEARDLDPLSLLYRLHDALIDFYERDWERAEAGFQAVLGVAPQHVVALALLGGLLLCRGDVGAGLAIYRTLQQQAPALSIGDCGVAQALALGGDDAGARAVLARLEAAYEAAQVSPYQVAMVQSRLGDAASTLHWLEVAASRADFNFVCTAVDPTFDSLRGSEGFNALMRRHGFAHLAV
jgi:tetratricopeptide (TPR) repeat protein